MTDPALEPGQVTKRELANALGKSERTVEKWANQLAMPRAGYVTRGGRQHAVYDLEECRAWAGEQGFLDEDQGEASGLKAELDQAELRKKKLQGDKLSLEVALKTGKVLDAEEVAKAQDRRILAVKAVLSALAAKIEQRCGSVAGGVAREEVDRALREFSGKGRSDG